MSNYITKLALFYLSKKNIYPAPMTEKNELQSLMNKLRPVSCGKDLIRLGPDGDGGYLVPNDLEGIKACFSPGVDYVSGFEKDCADMGMDVYLADNSVEEASESHNRFNFTKKYLGVTTNDSFMTLDDWVSSSLPESQDDLLLQIDIEGFEYECFLAATDKLMKRFRIIVAEFHHLDHFWNKRFFDLASRSFDKILQTHSCVHNHPNNCCGSVMKDGLEIPSATEIAFLRNDRVKKPSFINTFPNPLDFDNVDKDPLYLPKCWYT